jgi:hypothetical protein
MLLVAFTDNGVLGFRHERIALLPRHRGETAAFLPADLVEDDLGELAFCSAPCGFGPNSGCSLGCGFRSLDRRLCLRCSPRGLPHDRVPPLDWGATIRVSREKASANLVGTSVLFGRFSGKFFSRFLYYFVRSLTSSRPSFDFRARNGVLRVNHPARFTE